MIVATVISALAVDCSLNLSLIRSGCALAGRPAEPPADTAVKVLHLPFDASSAALADFVRGLYAGKVADVCVDPLQRREGYIRTTRAMAMALVSLRAPPRFMNALLRFELVPESPDEVFARLYENGKLTAFGTCPFSANLLEGFTPRSFGENASLRDNSW